MPTRDVSKDVANIAEFYRLLGAALEASEDDEATLNAPLRFLTELDLRELTMVLRGLTYSVITTLTPDSQITVPGSTDQEDAIAEQLVRLERLGEQEAAQLVTFALAAQTPTLAAMVAVVLGLPIVTLVQSGQLTLGALTGQGERN